MGLLMVSTQEKVRVWHVILRVVLHVDAGGVEWVSTFLWLHCESIDRKSRANRPRNKRLVVAFWEEAVYQCLVTGEHEPRSTQMDD